MKKKKSGKRKKEERRKKREKEILKFKKRGFKHFEIRNWVYFEYFQKFKSFIYNIFDPHYLNH